MSICRRGQLRWLRLCPGMDCMSRECTDARSDLFQISTWFNNRDEQARPSYGSPK